MNSQDAFERVLESLHRASLDESLWPATATRIADAVGAVGNALVVGEGSFDDAHMHFARYSYRDEPRQDLVREYFDIYYPHDTGIRRLMGRPDSRLVAIPDLYTADELKTSPVYNEILRRMHGQNGLYARIDEADGLRMVWGISDPATAGGWGSDQLALIEHLRPHIRQFVIVRQALAAAGALAGGLAGLLDNRRIGVLQLDRHGRLLAANASARDLLRKGDGLHDEGGALGASLAADDERLQRLLGRALPGTGSRSPAAGSTTIRRPSGLPRLGLHVSPLGAQSAEFRGRRLAALVFVVDPANRPRIDPAWVSAALDLRPSEGRVAALLAEGRSVPEIAAEAGLRENYVRRLLKGIYRKQGLSGQVALVRQVLALETLPKH